MEKQIRINSSNEEGATPIAKLVALANSYESSIYITKDGIKVNAKSIMGMMNLVLSSDTQVTVEAVGADENEAISDIEKFLSDLGN